MSRAQKEARRATRRRRNPFVVVESNLNRLGPGLIEKINGCAVDPMRSWPMREWASTLQGSFFACNCDLDIFSKRMAVLVDEHSDQVIGSVPIRNGHAFYVDRGGHCFVDIMREFVSLHRDFLAEQMLLGHDSKRTSFKDLILESSVYQSVTLGR